MESLGLIDEERMQLLPKQYKKAHEFCFYLHDQLVNLLLEYEQFGVKEIVFDGLQQAIKESDTEDEVEDLDLLKFMKENDLDEYYRQHIISHTVVALTTDMLNFIYEALKCFEKRKFSVAFALLRKPFKEHLFFLTWILADESDFIARFESDNYKSFKGIRNNEEERIGIIDKAIKKLYLKDAFDAQTLSDYLYSKKHVNGFEPTWQRATHLTTHMGALLKTEDYSLNFIFEDTFDDYYFEFLEQNLPHIFLYIFHVTLECFNRVHPVYEKTVSHLVLTTMGCYEALFLDGRSKSIRNMLQKQLGDFLHCLHCKEEFKLNKRNAPEFYLHESFVCESCGMRSDFPLYWILAKSDFSLRDDEK